MEPPADSHETVEHSVTLSSQIPKFRFSNRHPARSTSFILKRHLNQSGKSLLDALKKITIKETQSKECLPFTYSKPTPF